MSLHHTSHCSISTVLDAMCSTLAAMGIHVEQYHSESCDGQFEIVTAHAPAMAAADDVTRTREALKAVAAQHGMVLSFLPKLYPSAAGNGCHCHVSLWKVWSTHAHGHARKVMPCAMHLQEGQSVMADANATLTVVADHFFGGVLGHLPGLLPFSMGSTNRHVVLHLCGNASTKASMRQYALIIKQCGAHV